MKTFYSFKDAIFKKCPICEGHISFDNQHIISSYYNFSSYQQEITFYLNNEDTITINFETDEVKILIQYHSSHKLYNTSNNKYYISPSNNHQGIISHIIKLECFSCHNYKYQIKAYFDLSEKCIYKINLIQEDFKVPENKTILHIISNNYLNNRTTYSKVDCNEDITLQIHSKSIQIPLIGFNLKNPQETIDRIKNLIIFS